jgi:hypothetical protein
MKDYEASLEKLRRDAAQYRLISELAIDHQKRQTFGKLAKHMTALADQVELAIAAAQNDPTFQAEQP